MLTVQFFRRKLLEVVTAASASQSEALRVVLEEQMISGDRKLLRRLVSDIGRSPSIAWIGLVDSTGRIQISSDPAQLDRVMSRSSPDCQICHSHAPAQRMHSVTLVRPEGDVLRSVTPLMNRAACQGCHGVERQFNGVLIIDHSLAPLESAVVSSRTQVAAGGAAALIVLLGSLGFAVERLVLLRLRRLRQAARSLGQGDLAARATVGADDEVGGLAQDFNAMAERLATAMAHLAAQRRQLHELVDGIADGVVLVDPRMRVLATNRAFTRRLPEGVHASVASSYAELARSAGFEGASGGLTPAERALSSGRLEKEMVRVAGPAGERFEEIYAQPLRGADGQVAGAIEVWRDITERKALEAGLEQSERLAGLGIIASSVAHEVGNPLASIATAVEGLLRRVDEPGGAQTAELRDYLEIVRNQVFRCRGVTQRLLGFARVPTAQPATVDAARAAREVLALVGPQARAQQVEVRARLDTPAPASAEEMLLEQVFLNLVLNALQAMPDGGALEVYARIEAGAVLVTVSDTGPGIPESVREHLFQPFRRARAGGVGTGLGLFLSQTLVHRCGGKIAVESGPGKGAAFTVRLKAAAAPATNPEGDGA
ncbi:MAG: sensor histidine kinase [Myxococcaceae bacterium]